jgi:hypothetical protein
MNYLFKIAFSSKPLAFISLSQRDITLYFSFITELILNLMKIIFNAEENIKASTAIVKFCDCLRNRLFIITQIIDKNRRFLHSKQFKNFILILL